MSGGKSRSSDAKKKLRINHARKNEGKEGQEVKEAKEGREERDGEKEEK